MALSAFDNPAAATRFLLTPHPEVEGRAPFDAALTEIGGHQVEEIIERGLQRVAQIIATPRPYNLFKNNCEHTVYRAVLGREHSPQVLLLVSIASVLSFLIFGRKR